MKLFSVFILIVSCTQIKQVKSKPEYSDVDFNSFSLIELTSIKEGPFVKPKFSLNNSAVFFLSYDLSSLYYEKLASDQVINIYSSEEKITEYLPIGSSDSAFVVERNYSPKSQIKSSLIFVISLLITFKLSIWLKLLSSDAFQKHGIIGIFNSFSK